jgi:hypothetical protein
VARVFELAADLQRVVRAEEPGPIAGERRLDRRARDPQRAEQRRAPLVMFVTLSKRLGSADRRSPARCPERTRSARPARSRRCSTTTRASGSQTSSPVRGGAVQCGFERQDDRRLIVIVLKFVMKALHELPARSELPRQFSVDLVGLRGSRCSGGVPGWLS